MKIKKGWIVAITFNDHCKEFKGSDKDNAQMTFTAYGEVKSAKGKQIILYTWKHHEIDDDTNSETAKILKSTIIKWNRLKKC